ncbi:hypothetical protein MN205_00240 [Kineococcus sp. TRM81007]|uniref:BadF/BadG/BcrA/BcrD ATPase family protein n=1 Tax=Kineococcus sp. TRM81007 TaxID=2925831 RepID=UPI001F59152C|nr:BadF/BadG/BcrA/BcrD ATPase family protein [Kineococcus sp. TRM81007]MCI2236923.1 hypothetical protein [Kineococcus sp. TRM81007]
MGGTKTHVAVLAPGTARRDVVAPSADWRRGSLFSDPDNLARLASTVLAVAGAHASPAAPPAGGTHVVLGVHGVDTEEQRRAATAGLSRLLPGTVDVVNDAELLGPAAGVRPCLQLIVGTGAVVRGRDSTGTVVTADGYGAVLADDGSAPALVRETVRAALRLADTRGPDAAATDPAVALLTAAYGAPDLPTLALSVSAEAAYAWGRHAPLVFEALDAGSTVARAVVERAAQVLAGNVAALRHRGATGSVVVGAGGVLTAQPVLQQQVREELRARCPELSLRVLTTAPVEGALALAGAPVS